MNECVYESEKGSKVCT